MVTRVSPVGATSTAQWTSQNPAKGPTMALAPSEPCWARPDQGSIQLPVQPRVPSTWATWSRVCSGPTAEGMWTVRSFTASHRPPTPPANCSHCEAQVAQESLQFAGWGVRCRPGG